MCSKNKDGDVRIGPANRSKRQKIAGTKVKTKAINGARDEESKLS